MCFARQPDQALGDVIVGRKIVAFGQDSAAFATIHGCRPVECRGKQLEQIDRGGIGDDNAARFAPMTVPAAATLSGRSTQPALFQLRIRSTPHSLVSASATR